MAMTRFAELNPLLTKELRGRMRGWRAIAVLTVYLLVLAGFTWLVYALIALNSNGNDVSNAQLGKVLLGTVVGFQLFFVTLLAPAFTAGIITGEREKQTYDLLMTTLLRPRSIILGKMGAALAWLLLLVLAVVPLSSLAFILGGVAPEEVILSLVVILAAAFWYGAIGLFWSSVVKSTIVAVVLALLTNAFLLVLAPIIYFIAIAFITFSGNGTPPAILRSPPVLYLNELILSCHPAYALGRSEGYLVEGKSLFFPTVTLNGFDVWMIHPWLFFTLVSLVFGTVLVLLAIRNLPPVRRHAARGVYTPRAPGTVAPLPTEEAMSTTLTAPSAVMPPQPGMPGGPGMPGIPEVPPAIPTPIVEPLTPTMPEPFTPPAIPGPPAEPPPPAAPAPPPEPSGPAVPMVPKPAPPLPESQAARVDGEGNPALPPSVSFIEGRTRPAPRKDY
jgi:ABC-type transport system involved in multi-copper enzyme maturation permease subunit